MSKDPKIFLHHILDSIETIEEHIGSESKHAFLEDKKAQDAVIRRLEIIGEATKNLTRGFTEKHTTVPWSKIAKMRDKLIHGYFGVDLDLTYDVVKKELPKLKKAVRRILMTLEK